MNKSRMTKREKEAIKKAKEFRPMGDNCPICYKEFWYGCDHDVSEARQAIYDNYMKLF